MAEPVIMYTRKGCNYLASQGQVCNKCGRLHDKPWEPMSDFRSPDSVSQQVGFLKSLGVDVGQGLVKPEGR